MSLAAADVVSRARELWPVLTELVMPNALGLVWVPFALRVAGSSYDPDRLDAAAHALAHAMATEPAAGLTAHGAIASLKTATLSAAFSPVSTGSTGTDARLDSTFPGQALLVMRATCLDVMPLLIC